ncbi:MAG TPA: hypothetical protein PLA90_14835 [Candidatus Sumerlaeota bacterium]|nr:hypothetical protein [Candidatus Sumerlaeota bacterium]
MTKTRWYHRKRPRVMLLCASIVIVGAVLFGIFGRDSEDPGIAALKKASSEMRTKTYEYTYRFVAGFCREEHPLEIKHCVTEVIRLNMPEKAGLLGGWLTITDEEKGNKATVDNLLVIISCEGKDDIKFPEGWIYSSEQYVYDKDTFSLGLHGGLDYLIDPHPDSLKAMMYYKGSTIAPHGRQRNFLAYSGETGNGMVIWYMKFEDVSILDEIFDKM